jgi:LPS sulfotransferase NodH
MWEQMAYCVQFLRQLPQYRQFNYEKNAPELISTVFSNVSYVWIIRRDKVRQAVSDELAIQTGNYAWIGDQKPISEREPIFNFTRLDFQVNRIIAGDHAWQQYFIEAGVTPFKVAYDQFVEESDGTLRAILEYLNIHIPPNHSFDRPKLKKMADALNDEWTQRYNEMKTQQPEKDARIKQHLAQWYSFNAEAFKKR